MANKLWWLKYRPADLSGYVFQNEKHKRFILKCIEEKSIPHLIFSGHRGTGKTTLAFLLKNELGLDDSDFLMLNASKDTSIEDIRGKVMDFISSFAHGDFKIVFFDEAELLSSVAQKALKNLTEEYADNARFIFTTNNVNKLLPELRSRAGQELSFTGFDKQQVLEKAALILKKEKVKASLELLESYVNSTYPDFRKLLNQLQHNSHNGVLLESSDSDKIFEFKMQMVELMEADNWEEVRSTVCPNISDDEWPEMYRFLYDYLHDVTKFKDLKKWKAGIIIIADHLYRHSIVADPEINAAAMFIRLGDI